MKRESDLRLRIAKHLESRGVYAIVTHNNRVVRLDGEVDSPEMKRAASDLVFEIEPSMLIDNQLEVMSYLAVAENVGESATDLLTEALRSLEPEVVARVHGVDEVDEELEIES